MNSLTRNEFTLEEQNVAERMSQTEIKKWNTLHPDNPIGEKHIREQKLSFVHHYLWDNKPLLSISRDRATNEVCVKIRSLNPLERLIRWIFGNHCDHRDTILNETIKDIAHQALQPSPAAGIPFRYVDLSKNKSISSKDIRNSIANSPDSISLPIDESLYDRFTDVLIPHPHIFDYHPHHRCEYYKGPKYAMLANCLSDGRLCKEEIDSYKAYRNMINDKMLALDPLLDRTSTKAHYKGWELDFSADKELLDDDLIKIFRNFPNGHKLKSLDISSSTHLTANGVKLALAELAKRPELRLDELRVPLQFKYLVAAYNTPINEAGENLAYQISNISTPRGRDPMVSDRDLQSPIYRASPRQDFREQIKDLSKEDSIALILNNPYLSLSNANLEDRLQHTLVLPHDKGFSLEDVKTILSRSTTLRTLSFRGADGYDKVWIGSDQIKLMRACMDWETRLPQHKPLINQFLKASLLDRNEADLEQLAPQLTLFFKELHEKMNPAALSPNEIVAINLLSHREPDFWKTPPFLPKTLLDNQDMMGELTKCKEKVVSIETFSSNEALDDIEFINLLPKLKSLVLPNTVIGMSQIHSLSDARNRGRESPIERLVVNRIDPQWDGKRSGSYGQHVSQFDRAPLTLKYLQFTATPITNKDLENILLLRSAEHVVLDINENVVGKTQELSLKERTSFRLPYGQFASFEFPDPLKTVTMLHTPASYCTLSSNLIVDDHNSYDRFGPLSKQVTTLNVGKAVRVVDRNAGPLLAKCKDIQFLNLSYQDFGSLFNYIKFSDLYQLSFNTLGDSEDARKQFLEDFKSNLPTFLEHLSTYQFLLVFDVPNPTLKKSMKDLVAAELSNPKYTQAQKDIINSRWWN